MKIIITSIFLVLFIFAILFFYNQSNSLAPNTKIDKILVEKSRREMHVFFQGKLLKTYKVALGFNPIGHKQFEGDGKTPEGLYYINDKNPNSAYYKNLGVSYPNDKDRAFADSLGKSPGGLIKIHGIKNGVGSLGEIIQLRDWTAGCIAVTNDEMEELYNAVPIGTPIEIRQ